MSGLANIGNTCAINSLIQCINHSLPESNKKELLKISKNTISKSLFLLLKMMNENPTKVIKPGRFISDIFENTTLFKMGQQLDSSELWVYLSNKIFEEIGIKIEKEEEIFNSDIHMKAYEQVMLHNNKRESVWNDIYQGVTVTITKCKKCEEKYYNFETFYNLSIKVEGSVIESLKNLFLPNEYKDDWKCEKCKEKTSYIKTTRFWKIPKILVLSINRFDNNMKKVNTEVIINKRLNFHKNICINNDNFLYKLNSCVHHYGNYSNGHYISTLKHEDKIELYDDSVKRDIKDEESYYKSDNIYMIFYKLSGISHPI
tara:strand:+ start:883 stop:1827 length:945 start_codon:yes stop_codon:yes gene_type:complete